MAYSIGQIITMNLDGTDREYRILKLDGNIAEVVAMFSPKTDCMFNVSENTYSGGYLDTYLNTTWYGGLTDTAKNAIVSKTLTQYQYAYNKSVYNGTTHSSYANYSTKAVKESGLSRKVYALDVEDIENYFNHTFSKQDIWELFWNVRSKPATVTYPWLRSAYTGISTGVWYISGYSGSVYDSRVGNNSAVRPAFTIDLSKIFPTGYSITYHANGGTPEPENLTEQTNLPSPLPTVSKSGYSFDGWYTDSTFTTPAVAGAAISADTNLYAKFTRSHITLDLSTIGLPEGTHSIQMKLSDGGVTKRDSELSNAVQYTVAPQ